MMRRERTNGQVAQWPSGQGRTKTILFVRLIAYVLLSLSSFATEPLQPVLASTLPSLFRGVVVANSPLGVRVVSVEGVSQAFLADLRPEDIIVRVQNAEIRSIDEFAALSNALKGRVVTVRILVFRNGAPHELALHLYSYPILREWGIEFVPEHDLRFAESQIGLDYWLRLGRGFEEAGKPAEALNAYLNGLHNVPTDVSTAIKVAALFSREGHERLHEDRLPEGIALLRQALLIMQKLFDYQLTEDQLRTVRDQLQGTLQALRDLHVEKPRGAPARS